MAKKKRKGQANQSTPCLIYTVGSRGRGEGSKKQYFAGFSKVTGKPLWRNRPKAQEFSSIRESRETLVICRSFYAESKTIALLPLGVPEVFIDWDKVFVPTDVQTNANLRQPLPAPESPLCIVALKPKTKPK
jgi:hypothetical protein